MQANRKHPPRLLLVAVAILAFGAFASPALGEYYFAGGAAGYGTLAANGQAGYYRGELPHGQGTFGPFMNNQTNGTPKAINWNFSGSF